MVMYAIGTGATSTVYCTNHLHYPCALSLAEIVKNYPGFGFHLIHESTLINNNLMNDNLPYNPSIATMINGCQFTISYRKQRCFKKLKIRNLKDLGQ